MKERPDEFEVMVAGRVWTTYGVYGTRQEAQEAAQGAIERGYDHVAIKPQIKAYRPFQTHTMEVVYERVRNE